MPNASPIGELTFRRNSNLLAESDFGGHVFWRDVRTGAIERSMKLAPDGAFGMAISPDGRRIALARNNGATVYDARSEKVLFTVGGFKGEVDGVDFSPDGNLLAIAGGPAIVVDGHTGAPRYPLQDAASGFAIRIKFSPDGRVIATGDAADGSARIWDAKTGRLLHVLSGHTGAIFRIAFSRDGKLLATGSLDGTAKIWQVSDPAATPLTLQGHTAAVYDVAFTPDGRRLIDSSRDDTARIDAINLDDLVRIARSRLTRTLTTAECRQYLHRATCPPGRQ